MTVRVGITDRAEFPLVFPALKLGFQNAGFCLCGAAPEAGDIKSEAVFLSREVAGISMSSLQVIADLSLHVFGGNTGVKQRRYECIILNSEYSVVVSSVL